MARSGSEGIEQRLDRLVSAGRQLVDGVSGARPGSRRPGQRLNPGQLGRWVENKLDWLLDDDEDWREPWQEERSPGSALAVPSRRRPLEAMSRRGRQVAPQAAPVPLDNQPEDDWPEDGAFAVPRWQRTESSRGVPGATSAEARDDAPLADAPLGDAPFGDAPSAPSRPLPRSSRRR